MGLKEGGLRGSLRYVSVGVSAIPDSAIHRNKMDEGSGTTAADTIGSNDLTLTGATWVSGGGNGGYHLSGDGTDDEANYNSVPVTGSQNRAFATWVKWPSAPSDIQYIMDSGALPNNYERWSLASDAGNVRFEITGVGETTSLTFATGTWQPVGVTLNGSTFGDHLVYLDGSTYTTTGTETVNTGNDAAGLFYRATDPLGYAAVDIDDPIWWDRALTASEFDEWVSATEGNYP